MIYSLEYVQALWMEMKLDHPYTTTVLTNGCFDVIHLGHIRYLKTARNLGPLMVAINSDDSVRKLKGDTRPIYPEDARLEVLDSLSCVTAAFIFDGDLPAVIRALRPDYWVKASDYTLETLNPLEVAAAREVGAEIKLIPMTAGYSTTKTIERMRA